MISLKRLSFFTFAILFALSYTAALRAVWKLRSLEINLRRSGGKPHFPDLRDPKLE